MLGSFVLSVLTLTHTHPLVRILWLTGFTMETQGCHSCVCERLDSPWKHKGVTVVYVSDWIHRGNTRVSQLCMCRWWRWWMHYLCVTLTSKCHGLCRKCMSIGAHAVIWYVRYGMCRWMDCNHKVFLWKYTCTWSSWCEPHKLPLNHDVK